jgi:hypothetical protein
MMVRVVGMLAALALTGCGVGLEAEDPEGAAAVGTSQAQLQTCHDRTTCSEMPVVIVGGTAQSALVGKTPGSVQLPQDPIPWRPPTQVSDRPFGPNTPGTGLPNH